MNDYSADVKVVILGEGLTSRSDERNQDQWQKELDQHRSNIFKAQKKIGYQSLSIHNVADNRFDSVDLLDIVKIVEKERAEFNPDYIFTHHGGDMNIDHQLTFHAVMTASRSLAHETLQGIVTFETPSSTEYQASNHPMPFHPNFFIGISENNLNAKMEGMECYDFEKRAFPHPRSPTALKIIAQRWGIAVGKPLAEAFMIIRLIN